MDIQLERIFNFQTINGIKPHAIDELDNLYKKNDYVNLINKIKLLISSNNKNNQLYLKVNDYDNSINYFKEAIKIEPKNYTAFDNIGNILIILHKYQDATIRKHKSASVIGEIYLTESIL